MSEGELTKTYSDVNVWSDVDMDDGSGDDSICASYVQDENDSSCCGHDEEDLLCTSRHISKKDFRCGPDHAWRVCCLEMPLLIICI